jgi:hypothetical protein
MAGWMRRSAPALGLMGLAAFGLVACADGTSGSIGQMGGASNLLGSMASPNATNASRAGQDCNATFVFSNQSSTAVTRLVAVNTAPNSVESDLLRGNVITPGRQANLRAETVGNHHVRAFWANGRSVDLRSTNICRASQITLTNSGMRVAF